MALLEGVVADAAAIAAIQSGGNPAVLAALTTQWTAVLTIIYTAILTRGVVDPSGVVPMNVVVGAPGATPVIGTGRIT